MRHVHTCALAIVSQAGAARLSHRSIYPVRTGTGTIPTDEITIAAQLYMGLQQIFREHPQLQPRPLFITGESYAGKYVPSIGASCVCVCV
jgi:Serine carboxypeptidase